MTLLIPPGFAQAAFRISLSGDPEEMITTVGVDIAGTGQVEADAMRTWFIATFPVGDLSNQFTFRGVTLRVGQDGAPPVVIEAPANHVGTAVSAGALPNNCAYLVRKNTNRGGRQGRGRMYWPTFIGSEEEIDQRGMLSALAIDDLGDRFTSLASQVDLVLLHDDQSPGPNTPDAIVGLVLDNQIATQRRRMR